MEYKRNYWNLNANPPINADNLNNMESGISNATDGVNDLYDQLNSVVNSTIKPCDLNRHIKKISSGESWEATENCWLSINVNMGGTRDTTYTSVTVDNVVIFDSSSAWYYSSEFVSLILPPCFYVQKSQIIKVVKGNISCDIYGCI